MKHQSSYRRLLLLLSLMRFLRVGERQALFLQACILGFMGALAAMLFEWGTVAFRWLFTGEWMQSAVANFASMPEWQRLLLPPLGAIPAALVLMYAIRRSKRPVPEYMEAFSLGDGKLPRRQGFWRSLSAVISLGSGAAIGKEGALIQISAVAASAAGRWLHVSPTRLRVMVGCGAAAGMTAAFHTPLAACLFVCEIVIGTFSVTCLAPLLVASCSTYLLIHILGESGALFATAVHFQDTRELLLCVALASIAASLARGWVWLLGFFRRLFNGSAKWLLPRMVAAGLLVGLVAMYDPYIVGNGQEAIAALVQGKLSMEHVASLLSMKTLLVALVFAVGTMGGVLTPTLMLGAFIGALFGFGVDALGWEQGSEAIVCYAFVGMAVFFASAGRAPVTALLLVIELTMNASLIFPLMICVAVAYVVSELWPGRSLYDASVASGPASAFDAYLGQVSVADICRRSPMQVHEKMPMNRVLRVMLRHPGEIVPVEDENGCYLGLIPGKDTESLRGLHRAGDAMRRRCPVLYPRQSLAEALQAFEHSDLDSLPVVEPESRQLHGVLSRAELYQCSALMMRKELAHRA